MSSLITSALANLDGDLQEIESQVQRLNAGLDIDSEQLPQKLVDVCQQAATVRELIHAERPEADWRDREALDRLMAELDIAAQGRRNQQRRSRLLELAAELEAGRVKHRTQARTTTLNTLRLEGIQELRAEAARGDAVKDLPGPNASDWLHWACGLQDEKDAVVLNELRRDFASLERFTRNMEAKYWIPSVQESASESDEPSFPPAEQAITEPPAFLAPTSAGAVAVDEEKLPQDVGTQLETTIHSGRDILERASPREDNEVLSSFGEVPGKRQVTAWATSATIVVLSVIFAVIYHYRSTAHSYPRGTVAAGVVQSEGAAGNTDAPGQGAPESSQDNAKPTSSLLHQQPVEGAQDKILLSLELCRRGKSSGIECWGYVSNTGTGTSHVSLDRVDAIDGKGNTFSLARSSQLPFPTGHGTDVPSGSRVKYTVEVPDKDQEAQTLTLYLDLSDPRNLEYTFRNVPVAE